MERRTRASSTPSIITLRVRGDIARWQPLVRAIACLPHLVWTLESLVEGRVVNPIRVDEQVAHHARVALDQMLALPGETPKD